MGCAGSNTVVEVDSFPPVSLSAKPVPERDFHREYALKEKVSQGPFGVVYAATSTDTRHGSLAVRVVDLRDALSKDFDFEETMMRVDQCRQRRLVNETAILRVVSGHDNVCRFFERFFHEGLAYIVFEGYDRTLIDALESGPTMNEESLRPFFRGMLTGIAAIHARCVVLRDVKLDNFMCSGPGNTAKLCDFGVACTFASQGEMERTGCIGVFGTAAYMSPEMLGRKPYGAKVDVWSIGVVVHVLFCGCFPYTPHENTTSSMKEAILKGFPASEILLDAEQHRTSGVMSEEASHFIIDLLSRSATARPTSREAHRDEFFKSRSLSQTCLRGKLEAAKRCGAFANTSAKKAHIGNVDVRLRHLQDRCRRFATTEMDSSAFEVSADVGSKMGESCRSCESVTTP